MKKEVIACDFEHGVYAIKQECPTFATMNCTFCGKDFCLAHTAGEFRVSIATGSRMSEPTPQAAAAPFFPVVSRERAVPICKECGQRIFSLDVLQETTADILTRFLVKGIEAAKAGLATYALTKERSK